MIAIGFWCRTVLYVDTRRYRMVIMLFLHHEIGRRQAVLDRYRGT